MTELELEQQLATIRLSAAKTEKLQEETRKFVAESHRYNAETHKIYRELRWFPWLNLASSAVIAAAVAAFVARLHL